MKKYLNIGNLKNKMCCFWTQEVTWHPNIAQTFLLSYAITNEKTAKLIQVDTMPAASRTHAAETRSNDSGEYILLSHISQLAASPWIERVDLGKGFLFS